MTIVFLIKNKFNRILKIILFIAINFYATILFSQNNTFNLVQKVIESNQKKIPAKDSVLKNWINSLSYNLGISQSSLSNWSAGGDKFSITITSLLNINSKYQNKKYSWENNLVSNFGFINNTSEGSRKNDDRLDATSKVGYFLNNKLNLALLSNIRTGILKGYNYEGPIPKINSSFLSPAYAITSVGLDFSPINGGTIFFSPITPLWLIVTDPVIKSKGLYGLNATGNSQFEFGTFVSFNYSTDITPTIAYRGKLNFFSNYLLNPQNVDLFMTNFFNFRLSQLFSMTWSVDFIYDDKAKLFGPNSSSPALQFKSQFGIGLRFKK